MGALKSVGDGELGRVGMGKEHIRAFRRALYAESGDGL
eukprot:gene15430-14490_t